MSNYYVDGVYDYYGIPESDYTKEFDAYMVHNISVGYSFAEYNTNVSLGINNLFAEKPESEYINNDLAMSTNNFSVTEYDVNMDRFVYLRATVKF